jgi:hypothetical protein
MVENHRIETSYYMILIKQVVIPILAVSKIGIEFKGFSKTWKV